MNEACQCLPDDGLDGLNTTAGRGPYSYSRVRGLLNWAKRRSIFYTAGITLIYLYLQRRAYQVGSGPLGVLNFDMQGFSFPWGLFFRVSRVLLPIYLNTEKD